MVTMIENWKNWILRFHENFIRLKTNSSSDSNSDSLTLGEFVGNFGIFLKFKIENSISDL